MCNCNSSFCAVCCRRVKAYRFDNVPEITGDLQLYTEFYKVGEAYGHWKFTIDDLEAYFDIPVVNWQDKRVSFGKTATGGIDYSTSLTFDYSTDSFTVGTRGVGIEGVTSFSAGAGNIVTRDQSGAFGNGNDNTGERTYVFGDRNTVSAGSSNVFGSLNSVGGGDHNIFGNFNIISSGANNVFGFTNTISDSNTNVLGNNVISGGFTGNLFLTDSIGGVTGIANDAFSGQFLEGYRFMLDTSTVAVNISSTGLVNISNIPTTSSSVNLLTTNGGDIETRTIASLGIGTGTVTSVGMTITAATALSVAGSPITTSGTFAVTWTGANTQMVLGDGTLAALPTGTGTVTSVSAGNGMTFTTITTSGAVTLGTPSNITLASTNSVGVGTHSHAFVPGGTTAQYIRGDGTLATTPLGSVTSVGMTITGSTALTVAGSPITTSGTFAVTWTGNNTQYVAGDGSLITFPTLTSGTVTAVNSGAGMDFTNFTTSGTIILGTPSTITLASVNGASGTTHSHEFDLGGTAGQYLAGDNTLQTFPTIIDPTGKYVALSDSDAAYSSSTASATSTFRKNSELYGNGVTGAPSAGGYGHLKTFGASAGAYAWQIWKGVYDGDDLYFRSDGGGGYGSWIHIASTTYADNAANGRYVALNDTDAAYSGSVTDANSHTKNSELYGGGATNTPLSGYGFLKTHGASGGAYSWQEYKEVFDGDNRFFRGNASSTWTGSTWYQYASRQWVTAQGFTTNTGTVTNFSTHDLTTFTDPLFTVNVTNSTTTPDLTFTLPTLTQKLVFAAPWGVSGQPFWRQLLPSDLQADGATSGQVITWNGTAWVPQNAAGGGVTSVSAGNGMNFTTITTTGAVTMGTPSSITLSSTNGFPSATTHTHAFTPGGSATTQYVTGLGTLATNLWTDFGTFLQPTGGNNIRTNSAAGLGWIHMLVGDATHTGRLEWYNHLSARVGFIGYYEDRFCYFADSTYHSFEQTPVRIQSIATDNALTNLLVVNGTTNEIKKRTIASLTGLTTDVFKIQGGTTNASAITDDIYHNGKLKLGTSTSSAYQLSVSGTGYFTSTVDFNNNVGIQGFTTGAVIKNLIRLDGSNRVDIGVSGTDIILPAYLDSRNDSSVPANFIYTTSAGVTQSRSIQAVGNQYATVYRTNSSLGITSGGAATQLTTPTGSETSFISLYSISSNNIVLPNGAQHHKIVVTYDWVTASGTAANTDIETTLDTTTGGAWTGPKWRQNYSGIRGTITVHWSGQVPAGAGQLRAFAQVLSGGNINVFNVRITCDLVGTNT